MGRTRASTNQAQSELAWIEKCNRPILIEEAKARKLTVNQSMRKPDVQEMLRKHIEKEGTPHRLTTDEDDAEAEAEAEAEAAPAPAAKGRGKKRKAAEEPEAEAEAEAEPEAAEELEAEAPAPRFPLMAEQTDLIERLNKEAKENWKRLKELTDQNEAQVANNQALVAKCAELRKDADAQHTKFLAEQNRRMVHEKICDRVTMQILPTEEAYEAWKDQIIKECDKHGDKPESQVAVQPQSAVVAVQNAAPACDKKEMERILSVYKQACAPEFHELETSQERVHELEAKVGRVRRAASAVVAASAARVHALEAQLAQVNTESKVRAAAFNAGIDYDQL